MAGGGGLVLKPETTKRDEICLRLAFIEFCLQLAFTPFCLRVAFMGGLGQFVSFRFGGFTALSFQV